MFMETNDETKKFKANVLRDVCIGAGSCAIISPKVFKCDQEKKAIILEQGEQADKDGFVEITQDTLQNVLNAAQSCPVLAILVLDENGKQIFPQ